LAAQQEYLIARENQNALKALPGKASFSLSQAALERMKIWDIPASELNRLTKTGEVRRRLALLAPTTGVVLNKTAVQGMKFTAGETLFEIADLSQIWLLVDVFEQDLGLVKPGQKVNVKVNAYPNDVFDGTVAFIYPTLNSETRTVKVRIELDNKDGRLKPAMYGEANLQAALTTQPQVTVPESALIDSGTRQVVLVQTGNGKFAPRQVKTSGHGETASGERKVVIKEGLTDGESVVTSANFLIDSESNLQAAFSGLGTESTSASVPTKTIEATPVSASMPTSAAAMADMPGMTMTNDQNGGK
jgi:membrane fusion protein, copper/silver efflux system